MISLLTSAINHPEVLALGVLVGWLAPGNAKSIAQAAQSAYTYLKSKM